MRSICQSSTLLRRSIMGIVLIVCGLGWACGVERLADPQTI
jgi:hypothetical protein